MEKFHLVIPVFVVFIFIGLFSSYSFSQPLQSHPLSEITPIDVSLDMYGFNVTNVSYVGIGTTTPEYPLDVVGSGKVSVDLIVGNQIVFSSGPVIYASSNNIVFSSGLVLNGDLSMNFNSIYNANNINATTIYQNGKQVLDTATSFNGDVSGTYNNLQLGTGVVGTNELANNAVTTAKISQISCPSGYAMVSIGGGSYSCIKISAAEGVVNGSGITNYIPIWTGSNTLGNSVIYQNNGNVGIGTNSPSAKLDIIGEVKVRNGDTAGALRIVPWNTGGSQDVYFELYNGTLTGSGSKFYFTGAGGSLNTMTIDVLNQRVGIGTTNPQEKLHVVGSFKAESGGGLVRLDPSGNFWVGI